MRLLAVAVVMMGVVGVFGESAKQYQEYILQQHNNYRKMTKSSNMYKLKWNENLATEANSWVQQCKYNYDGDQYGTNIAYYVGNNEMDNMNRAFHDWYGEHEMYNYGNNCGNSCRYTQMVWYNTQNVGCAYHQCPYFETSEGHVKDAWVFACWYDPKGNAEGEYPYSMEGAPCSGCDNMQQCEEGLCMGNNCHDKTSNCVMFRNKGLCEGSYQYMKNNCPETCGFCNGNNNNNYNGHHYPGGYGGNNGQYYNNGYNNNGYNNWNNNGNGNGYNEYNNGYYYNGYNNGYNNGQYYQGYNNGYNGYNGYNDFNGGNNGQFHHMVGNNQYWQHPSSQSGCYDVHHKCFQMSGTCNSNPWMKTNCMQTCGFC